MGKWNDGIIKREDILKANLKTLFSFIQGQFTVVLRANIQAFPGYEDVFNDAKSLALLVMLKNHTTPKHRRILYKQSTRQTDISINLCKRRTHTTRAFVINLTTA